ncbi:MULTISPECIES: hypothetical protein [Tenacibaculum]|uniref:hypothetical protein n=1 Tax=Tenacibaculum TaxID=104267 RepID=UPI001E5F9066|nr:MULTISPECIES: hypothetical protein [Tenacibaculum]MCD8403920.1 hypothetical protein [Tenacibaculum finnmarkense genomovar finnmarkense]MCD8448063.1 hypothetical protein [Tenacibaculum finnmarkense genomovar finnmarkense]
MIEKKHTVLIEKLIKKTASKQAYWTKTSRETEFKLSLKNSVITTDLWNQNNQNLADIIIRNERGDVISQVSFNAEENPEEYELLKSLHNQARESYYKFDETIEDIFEELNSDEEVGDKNPPPDLAF